MAYYEKKASLSIKELEFDLNRFSEIEKRHSIEKRIIEINEELVLDENKLAWDYFNTTVMEYISKYQDQVDLSLLAQQVDPSFLNDRDKKIDKMFLSRSRLIEEAFDDLEPNQFSKIINPLDLDKGKPSLKTLPNLAKSVFTPKIKQFLVIKSLVEQKQFLEKYLTITGAAERLSSEVSSDIDKGQPTEWYKDDTPFELPPYGFTKIDLNLSPLQERKFLSFFYRENNTTETTFLSEKEVKELFKYGLVISDTPNKTLYKLDLNSKKKPANIIFYCFSILFKLYYKNRNAKGQLALFLKNNFVNFKDLELYYIKKEMRSDRKPKLLEFEINKYL